MPRLPYCREAGVPQGTRAGQHDEAIASRNSGSARSFPVIADYKLSFCCGCCSVCKSERPELKSVTIESISSQVLQNHCRAAVAAKGPEVAP